MQRSVGCRLNLLFFATIIYYLTSFCAINALAVARFAACTPAAPGSTSTGTGADNSNCDPGLMCDTGSSTCVYSTETGCVAGRVNCPIGQRCTVDTNGTITPVNNGSSGVCTSNANVSAENNAISDVICNAYKFVTGKVGRAIIVIVVFVTGVTFYLGKVSWGTVVAILIGAGLCFGGPAIVSVLIGGGKTC